MKNQIIRSQQSYIIIRPILYKKRQILHKNIISCLNIGTFIKKKAIKNKHFLLKYRNLLKIGTNKSGYTKIGKNRQIYIEIGKAIFNVSKSDFFSFNLYINPFSGKD